MFSTILFDFDGVLVNSRDFHLEKINTVMKVNMTPELYYDIHMGNFHDKVEGHEDVKNTDWIEYHERIHEDEVRQPLHPEVKEMLPELAKNKRLFVVSSGGEFGIKGFLEYHDMLKHFENILGHESGLSKRDKFQDLERKWGVDLEKTAFVTDTVGDIKEAKLFPITTVAVDFGFHTREDLEKAGADHVFSNWHSVKSLLES